MDRENGNATKQEIALTSYQHRDSSICGVVNLHLSNSKPIFERGCEAVTVTELMVLQDAMLNGVRGSMQNCVAGKRAIAEKDFRAVVAEVLTSGVLPETH